MHPTPPPPLVRSCLAYPAMAAAQYNFTTEEVAQYRELFNVTDRDGSGKLNVHEVHRLMQDVGEKLTLARVQEVVDEIDMNGDHEVDFNEFLACMHAAKSKPQGASAVGQLSGAVTKAATIYKVKGAANSEHSISEEERFAFSEHINRVLGPDPFLSQRLPMDPNSEQLFSQCADGIIFAKLVNLVEMGTVDERALNLKSKLTKFQVIENCNLAINAAKSIGCRVTNIGATDLMEGRPHLILGLCWQIIKAHLLNSISIKDHPELFRLLEEDETLESLQKLPPEQILLRWINFHLERGGSDRRVHNFGKDLADSEVYSVLLHQLDPVNCPVIPPGDRPERALHTIRNVQAMGLKPFLKPSDIASGNAKLNLGLIAQIFNFNPGLAQLTEDDMAEIGDQLAQLDLDDAGDTREERTFRMWVNSLNIEGLYVNDLFSDLCYGFPLLQIEDRVQPGIVPWKKVHMNPRGRIHVVDNCNMVVTLGKKMDLVLVNIGGPDIADKNKKLILAIMWQLMRLFTLKMVAQLSGDGTKITDKQVVAWANNKVASAGRSSLSIRNLHDSSLATGQFLIELCGAVNPNTVDWELVTAGETQEDQISNARYAISIARKLGACVFLTPEDIVEVKPKMLFTFIASLWTAELEGTVATGGAADARHRSFSPPRRGPSPPRAAAAAAASAAPPPPPKREEPVAAPAASYTQPAAAPPPPPPKVLSGPPPEPVRLTVGQDESYSSEQISGDAPAQGFKSINGTGERGGFYGSSSNLESAEAEVEEEEWGDD
uniref:Calmodulin n=1 Tax=Rhizochromulina marina TaxID=1034831 RepID=A0A7S2S2Z4_9STRA